MHASSKVISSDTNVSEEKAIVLFQDVLRYLWITNKHADEKKTIPREKRVAICIGDARRNARD